MFEDGATENGVSACREALAINPCHVPSLRLLAAGQEQLGLGDEAALTLQMAVDAEGL